MSSAQADVNAYKKPYYTIYFKAVRLGVEIRINDISAFIVDNTNNMSLEVSASEYIINGINEIKVISFPFFDDDDEQTDDYPDFAKITVGLYVREDGESDDKRVLISEATIEPTKAYMSKKTTDAVTINKNGPDYDKADVQIEVDSKLLTYPVYGTYKKQVVTSWKTTSIKTPFPQWEWQTGELIAESKETFDSLLKAYKKLHEIYRTKNIQKLKEINSHRSRELAIAYHLGGDDAGFEYAAIAKYLNHPRAKLYKEVDVENTRLVIMANGRIATIKSGGGTEPVFFADYEDEQIHNILNKWYKNKNGEWIMIR